MSVESLIITAAVTAVNMAVTASQTIEGPRLKDTSATVADYGAPLNYFVGQRVLATQCFFSKPIQEVKKQRKGKGGKAVEYSGFGTFAIAIADHEIAGVSKIWFDNHLVYDATGAEEKLYPLGEDYELEANMRIYLGTSDQDPDPDMEAYIEARDGAGTCPAYRNVSYIYFENIPLEMLGNRFPNVTVLARTATPGGFEGWYARAYIQYVNKSTNVLSWLVEPSTGGRIDYTDNPNYSSGDWLIRRTVGPDGDGFMVYWTNPNVMNATEVWLRMRFGTGSVASDMRVLFTFQFWNGEPSTPPTQTSVTISPGTPSWSSGNPFDIRSLFNDDWYFPILGDEEAPPQDYDAGSETQANLRQLLEFVSDRVGINPTDCDWSAGEDIVFSGYNWVQGTGRQILEPILDIFDVDVRPHDFTIEALPRGGSSEGAIATGHMVKGSDGGPPYNLKVTADSDLPRRVFLVYANRDADHNPNVAMPPGPDPVAAGAVREMTIDMQTLALTPDLAQQLAERRLRRLRFGRTSGEFSVTRQLIEMEPGDVWSPVFDDRAYSMRNLKLTIGANGVISGDWERDVAALATLPASEGAPSSGYVPEVVPDDIPALGFVMDLPLIADTDEQTAPLAYLAAGPEEPGTVMGWDYAHSDTGEMDSYAVNWDGIAAGGGSIIGTVAGALPYAVPWVPDMGSSISVAINFGELTSATLDQLLLDPLRNLAAIRSGAGWELVQFMTATLTDNREYTLTGFLRGVRGTEWAMGGHEEGDDFVLLDAVKLKTMGAAELGDTDYYVVSPTGQLPDEDNAFAVSYTGASHKPYAPVHGEAEFSGSDLLFEATRRTRIGGATLDGQDVPLGETAESWSLDIIDNSTSPPTVKRTINSSSLPITYTEAQQIEDWGAALDSMSPATIPEANLYQVAPPLSLRGYPLNFPEDEL